MSRSASDTSSQRLDGALEELRGHHHGLWLVAARQDDRLTEKTDLVDDFGQVVAGLGDSESLRGVVAHASRIHTGLLVQRSGLYNWGMRNPLESYADTLKHIQLLSDKRRRLEAAQIEAENQVIHRAAVDYRAGRIGLYDLIDLWVTFRDNALPGYSNRWKTAMPEHSPSRLSGLLRDRERSQLFMPDEDGNWRGEYPIDREIHSRPRKGVNVVYVLYDADNAPCYVGSTKDFYWRLEAHARNGKRFARWLAYSCPTRSDAYELETRLLREHKPYLNKRV